MTYKTMGNPGTIVNATAIEECPLGVFSAPSTVHQPVVAINWLATRGQEIPNYYQRLKRGELLPHTNFSQTLETGTSSGKTKGRRISDGCNTVITDDARSLSDIKADLLQKDFVGKALEGQDPRYWVQSAAASIYSKSFDAGTFLAESHKTLSMFKNALERVVNFKKNFRHLRRKDFDKAWLETRYGWRVLKYEIQDLNKAFSEDFNRSRWSQRDGISIPIDETDVTDVVWLWRQHTRTLTYKGSVSVRGSVTADINLNMLSINPFVTAYEIVPYSFVADWFVYAGQAIEALSFLAFAQDYSASWGYKFECDVTHVSDNAFPLDNQYSVDIFESESSYHYEEVMRVPASVPYYPLPRLRLDIDKIRDISSLLGVLT